MLIHLINMFQTVENTRLKIYECLKYIHFMIIKYSYNISFYYL